MICVALPLFSRTPSSQCEYLWLLTPFDKNTDELSAADLHRLIERSVAEGYFVEYKGSDFPAKVKIGHSIASFANTYGGWYIVGVQTDAHNVAKQVCGFDLAEYPDPISKIREIAKSHIDPTPIFYAKVIEIGGDKAVVVVHIPSDQEITCDYPEIPTVALYSTSRMPNTRARKLDLFYRVFSDCLLNYTRLRLTLT